MSKNNSSPKNPLTPTTIKIATLTGAAKDDVFELSEGTGIYELDVCQHRLTLSAFSRNILSHS